jgi:hypothetical protein
MKTTSVLLPVQLFQARCEGFGQPAFGSPEERFIVERYAFPCSDVSKM